MCVCVFCNTHFYVLCNAYTSNPLEICFGLLLHIKFVLHKFLPIKSELIDGFRCSRCLNDRIDLAYMIRLLASGANASLVAKNGTKKNFSNVAIFNCNCGLFRGRN